MNWYALQVTATLNSNIITVQDGDDVAILTDKHWIKVGNSKPYKIQSTRINSSNVPQIILASNFADSTRTTEAFAARSFDDLQVLTERATLLKDTAEPKINNFSTYTKSIFDTTDASQFRSRLNIVPNTRTISGSTHVEVTGDFTQDKIEVSLKDTVARKGHADNQVMTNEDLSKKFYSVDERAVWDKFLNSCTLIADFQNDYYEMNGEKKTFSEIFTFTRNSSKLITDKNGYLVEIRKNEIPYDYNPITKKLEGILIDPQSSNRLLYSSKLTNSVWIKNGVSVIDNEVSGPDNSLSATGLYSNSELGYISQNITLSTVDRHSFSLFIKPRNSTKTRVQIHDSFLDITWSDLSVETTLPSDSYNIELSNNGFYSIRVDSITITASSSVRIYPDITKSGSIFVYGCQVELHNQTTYIENEGNITTRDYDRLEIVNDMSWFASNYNGTFFLDFDYIGSRSKQNGFILNVGRSTNQYWGMFYSIPAGFSGATYFRNTENSKTISNSGLGTNSRNIAISGTSKTNNILEVCANSTYTSTTIAGISVPSATYLRFNAWDTFKGTRMRVKKLLYSPQSFTKQELEILSKPRI